MATTDKSDGHEPSADTPAADTPAGRPDWPTHLLVWALLRSVVIVVLYLVAYFLVPWDQFSDWWSLAIVIGFLVIAMATAVWQVGQILKSPAPAVHAIEALAIIGPIYLLAFSLCYFMMSENNPDQFTEPLSLMGSLYFTLSVFATVGFGDITAAVDVSRAVVSFQMVLNLIVVGVGIKVILAAVKWGRDIRDGKSSGPE
ncbi:potassium channel family protein [Nocardia sp. 348MFTsu5.1]|uniref:potassium channel family protein n=1 Tax=Nocardia sp. 348MFTsu5.1 TaxID=1172185 RepID=UPI00035C6260|nr:potassium channel family protein [Nocardia sp. 348MFTsu5.1]